MKQIKLHTLVLMVGPSGAGKSTAIKNLFNETEVVSSDSIRASMLGDFQIQANLPDVWDEVFRRVKLMLGFGQRVVVDATNLRTRDRTQFIDVAKQFGVDLVYVVVNRPVEQKLATAGWRTAYLINKHEELFNNNLKNIMSGDGVATVVTYDVDKIEVVQHVNSPNKNDAEWFSKGVTVIGDVHGNLVDLQHILHDADMNSRNVLFLGDIIDYGDSNLDVMDVVYRRICNGTARMIWGNHERKMNRWVDSNFGQDFKGTVTFGMSKTLDEIDAAMAINPMFKQKFIARWRMLHSNSRQHVVYNDHLFTHGAATVDMWNMQGHSLNGIHSNLAFFGEVDEKTPALEDGYPNRIYKWVDAIPAGKTVVVGHDPRDKAVPYEVTNKMGGRAIFLDTGSSKGGKLSCINL